MVGCGCGTRQREVLSSINNSCHSRAQFWILNSTESQKDGEEDGGGEKEIAPRWQGPPNVANFVRGFRNLFSGKNDTSSQKPIGCRVCGDTRRVPCPNCDGVGSYVAMGGRTIECTSCRGRGFVICRACFSSYGDDPYDIDAIRDLLSRMPD